MGTSSQPKEPNPILVNVFINGQQSNPIHDVDSAAPAPTFGLQAFGNAKDSEGKNIPVKVNVKNNSINGSDNTTSDNTSGEISSTCGKNIDNNIGQNSLSKELNNSSFNLFNNNNLENMNTNDISNKLDEKNKNENNNNIYENKNDEINNYEKPHPNENNNNNEIKNNNEINNSKKSDNKENNNNDNNLLKEGVQHKTKFGDEEEESSEKKSETNRGNDYDINMGKKENILNNQGNTDNGQQDINQGSRYEKEEKDKYIGYNYDESDLVISQIEGLTEEKTLEKSQVYLDKGNFPLLIKLNDKQPQFFLVDKHATLKLILKIYLDKTPQFDKNILDNIKLYFGKRLLDINEEIQFLQLKEYSIIKNIEAEKEEVLFQN